MKLLPLATCFALVGATAVGCTVRDGVGLTQSGTGGGGTGGSGDGGSSNLSGQELFEQTVKPGLVEHCGVCHSSSGIADFLAPPDPYASIKVYKSITTDRPILWPVPEESVLYWYPDSADHKNGKPYGDALADLKKAVRTWLAKEAETLPPISEETKHDIVPFTPVMGFNSVYLDPIGPDFKSSAIAFLAEEVGDPPSLLKITQLKVQPADSVGLRMVHPRFVVYPPGSTVPEPDPVDSLSDVDESFPKKDFTTGQFTGDQSLGPGTVFLANWKPGSRLTIDFKLGKIESFFLGAGGQIAVPCKNVAAYQSAVSMLDLGGPNYCAGKCHGGGRAEAKAAMNLSGLLDSPPNYNFACATMRTRITPGDVDNSQIMLVTDPGKPQVVHMYKFDGKADQYNAFKAGMKAWIESEAQ